MRPRDALLGGAGGQIPELLLADGREARALDGAGRLGGGVGAEDDHSVARYEEGVEVGDAHALAGEHADHVGGAAGAVVELDGEDIGHGYGGVGVLEHIVGPLRVVAEDAAYAVLSTFAPACAAPPAPPVSAPARPAANSAPNRT